MRWADAHQHLGPRNNPDLLCCAHSGPCERAHCAPRRGGPVAGSRTRSAPRAAGEGSDPEEMWKPVSTAPLLPKLPFCLKPQAASLQNHRTGAEHRAPSMALISLSGENYTTENTTLTRWKNSPRAATQFSVSAGGICSGGKTHPVHSQHELEKKAWQWVRAQCPPPCSSLWIQAPGGLRQRTHACTLSAASWLRAPGARERGLLWYPK